MRSQILVFILLPVALMFCSESTESSSTTNEAHATSSDDKPRHHTVAGVVSGFDCAVVGVLCPSTHRAADYTTGLFTDDEQFYFVVNIPQSFLTQHFLDRLEITGTIYEPYHHAIEPEEIRVVQESGKKLVYEEGYFIDPEGHKALFNEGRVVDGVWVCDECAGSR